MKESIQGVWFSEKLTEVPDYNSNFTNWVECIRYPGKIKLIIREEGERLVMEVHVPVIYYGGGKGTFELNTFLIDQDHSCIVGKTHEKHVSDIMLKEDVLTIKELFGIELRYRKAPLPN